MAPPTVGHSDNETGLFILLWIVNVLDCLAPDGACLMNIGGRRLPRLQGSHGIIRDNRRSGLL